MAAFASIPAALPRGGTASNTRLRLPLCAAEGPSLGAAPMQVTRRVVLSGIALAALSAAVPELSSAAEQTTLPSGLKYAVTKAGTGPKIQVGDLVALRFKGSYNNIAFDDLFSTSEPYFYRAGSNLVLPGIMEAVPLMSVGEQWALEIPGKLAFGDKGRRASAGKPSIPPNATVYYDLLVESIPGRMEELIELTGDDYE